MGFYPFRFGASSEACNDWTRPSDWLSLPNIQPPTEGIAALVAVSEDGYGNLVSLKMTISDSATWTVDWGDGSTPEEIASGATATHDYDWADVGDVTSEGWRQAVLTVYPATGKTFATINLAAPVAAGVRNTGWSSPLRQVVLCAAVATSSRFSDLDVTRGGRSPYVQSIAYRTIGSPPHLPVMRACTDLQEYLARDFTATATCSGSAFMGTALKSWPGGLNFLSNHTQTFRSAAGPRTLTLDFGGQGVDILYMFNSSIGIESVRLTNIASGSSASLFYASSVSEAYIDRLPNATAAYLCYQSAMQRLEIADASNLTNLDSAFSGCSALEELILTGLTIGVSIANCNLSAAALDAFFTALGTASGAQTITITGNPGAATCDTSIATAKGWTVTV